MAPATLEPAGWLLLAVSWSAIGATVLFCLRRVLRSGRSSDDRAGR